MGQILIGLLALLLMGACDIPAPAKQIIQQPGQFQLELPSTWTLTLQDPYWAQKQMESQDTNNISLSPQFSALSPPTPSPESAILLTIFGEHREGSMIVLQELGDWWVSQVDNASFSAFDVSESRGLRVLTATGTARDRSRNQDIGVFLAVFGSNDRPRDAWLMVCTGVRSAAQTLTHTCTQIRDSFQVLPALPGQPR